jgi:hypothetical protein
MTAEELLARYAAGERDFSRIVGFRFALLGALPWSGDPTGAHPLPNLRFSICFEIEL